MDATRHNIRLQLHPQGVFFNNSIKTRSRTGDKDYLNNLTLWAPIEEILKGTYCVCLYEAIMKHIQELSSKTLLPGLHLYMYVFQIRINSVNPTVVLTPLGKIGFGTPEKQAQRKNRIPLGRLAGTLNVALVIHLACYYKIHHYF